MGIGNFIERICVQTAVYWGAPIKDGYGTLTYDAPVEIACRWEEKTEVVSKLGEGRKGEEFISTAQVFVTRDVDEQGYLYLGDLDDLSIIEEASPETVDGAYRIQKFGKIPAIRASTVEFVRKAYL